MASVTVNDNTFRKSSVTTIVNQDIILDEGGANEVSAADIKAHQSNTAIHFEIDDATPATDKTYSSDKVESLVTSNAVCNIDVYDMRALSGEIGSDVNFFSGYDIVYYLTTCYWNPVSLGSVSYPNNMNLLAHYSEGAVQSNFSSTIPQAFRNYHYGNNGLFCIIGESDSYAVRPSELLLYCFEEDFFAWSGVGVASGEGPHGRYIYEVGSGHPISGTVWGNLAPSWDTAWTDVRSSQWICRGSSGILTRGNIAKWQSSSVISSDYTWAEGLDGWNRSLYYTVGPEYCIEAFKEKGYDGKGALYYKGDFAEPEWMASGGIGGTDWDNYFTPMAHYYRIKQMYPDCPYNDICIVFAAGQDSVYMHTSYGHGIHQRCAKLWEFTVNRFVGKSVKVTDHRNYATRP